MTKERVRGISEVGLNRYAENPYRLTRKNLGVSYLAYLPPYDYLYRLKQQDISHQI